ncbi:MAG: hypothetical protein IJC06_03425 [Clostridia bacterium]|nr:hypothetical protein [Clostridia bacterium]
MTKEEQKQIRKWLSSYRILKRTVQLKEKHLEDFISIMYNPIKQTIVKTVSAKDWEQDISVSIMNKIEKIYLEIIEDLKQDLVNMKQQMQEIFDVINSLNNYERSVCFNRYILGCSWNDIAAQIGYEVRQCQRFDLSAIRNIAKNYSGNFYDVINKY